MNNLYTIYILLLLVTFSSLSHAQGVDEYNTTVFIFQDDNNNGVKEPEEPYLSGFSLDVTGFDGLPILFEETNDGVFQGYIPRRARVVVNGYSGGLIEGNGLGT